jgi:hypothetical protein
MLKKYHKSHRLLGNLKYDNRHKLLRNLKSQAALEFLTTYAWAFLVILVMMGALAYFGILKPTKLLPDRCNFGTEINCIDYRISYGTDGTDGTFNLRLKNNVGEAIKVTAVGLTTEATALFECTGASSPAMSEASPYTWSTGSITDFSFATCNVADVGFVKGDKAKLSITIDYYLAKTSSTYKRQVAGEVFSTVT